jgi:hypothetical protein
VSLHEPPSVTLPPKDAGEAKGDLGSILHDPPGLIREPPDVALDIAFDLAG